MSLIDHYPEGWIASTRRWMDELAERQPESSFYLLMDAAFQHDAVLPFLRTHLSADDWHALYANALNVSDKVLAVSPMLITLNDHRHEWLDALLMLTSGLPMVSLMATHESRDMLLQRLSAFRIVTVQNQRYVLRLADTRRLPQIIAILEPEQHAALMGDADWYYVDRDTTWQALPRPERIAAPLDRITFSDTQTDALIVMNDLDAFIDNLRQSEPQLYAAFALPSQRYQWIASTLANASEPLRDYAEKVRCCRQAANEEQLDSQNIAMTKDMT